MNVKHCLSTLLMALFFIPPIWSENINVHFTRTGTDATSVTASLTDDTGASINGASAMFTSSHELRGTAGVITQNIICPNINGNTNPTIKLTITISGLSEGFTFNTIGLDIHALNGSNAYQQPGDGKIRQWNIDAKTSTGGNEAVLFGTLSNIDIAAGVGSSGNVHKVWNIESNNSVTINGSTTIEFTITKGSTNEGCFFGFSQITLSTTEREPTTTPEESKGKIYNIIWKNTGGNYMTEGSNGSIYVGSYSTTERQFWQFIPSGNENCYYIRNTATGNYISSCNKTPSSASKITTSTTPVEYYIAPTTATSGEIVGCHYFSSTDCSNYDKEDSSPRALNKDGASNFVITWQAGTSRTGSYWKLVETEDLYEVRPFEPSNAIGSIATSYNIGTNNKNLTLSSNNITLTTKEQSNESQGWYFVGTTNREGYLIASTKEPLTTIGISDGKITATTSTDTRWKVYTDNNSKYYFKSASNGQTLLIDGDSLFTFDRQRSNYSRKQQIYNNPCGYLASNYITTAELTGTDVLETITYETNSKPSNWHVLYTGDKGVIGKEGEFTLDITLAQAANEYLEIHTFFDWDADGIFETSQKMNINENKSSETFKVPAEAAMTATRMRVRVNENALNLAEDDVEGVVYDFIIAVAPAMERRTVSVDVNNEGRGNVTLSPTADDYEKGTTLTATATATGNSTFICWKEGNIIVSTNTEYSFNVTHNIKLTAYFSPDTSGSDDIITNIINISNQDNITITESSEYIQATSPYTVESLTIYNSNAAQVAKEKGNKISTSGLGKGIYIIKVRTSAGERNFKILK